MEKNRLEAFSDGVMAVAITLMVIELKAPASSSGLGSLTALAPSFLSYVLSFVFVGIYWNNHHHMFQAAKRINGAILWANLYLLFWITLFPFTTAWVSEHYAAPVPTAAYGVVLLMAAIAYALLQTLLIAQQGEGSLLAGAIGRDWKGRLSIVVYVAAIPLAFVRPWIADSLYAVIALIWLAPDRRIERILVKLEET
jgi:uncharacterized membrane protein